MKQSSHESQISRSLKRKTANPDLLIDAFKEKQKEEEAHRDDPVRSPAEGERWEDDFYDSFIRSKQKRIGLVRRSH